MEPLGTVRGSGIRGPIYIYIYICLFHLRNHLTDFDKISNFLSTLDTVGINITLTSIRPVQTG
jgi:hypothetical protein